MAWRSSGTTNDEMVDNLKRFGVIHTEPVEEAFRAVDRRFFVPRSMQYMAHTDQPLKEGHIHISAPHIYGSIVEALELKSNSSLSFLNLGCGTGYLSCIVAHILGPTSRHVGVDINANAVEHCRRSVQEWKDSTDRKVPEMDVIHGNVFHIDTDQGEAATGFDRMYVGASVDHRKLPQLVKMLRLGGIFVGPVDDELVKVVRISAESGYSVDGESSNPIPRNFGGHAPYLSPDFSMQVISSVRFTPLTNNPVMPTVLPSRIWDPSIHQSYPDSFRRSCKEIMLCSSVSVEQPPPQTPPSYRTNAAAKLPRAVWMEILSFTDRTWFEKPPAADQELLRKRLVEEQAATRRAQEARLQAESRLHSVRRERDVYRLLALRWQSRLQALLRERGDVADDDDTMAGLEDLSEVATAAFANEPLLLRLGSLSALMRQFQREGGSDDDGDDDEESLPDGEGESEADEMEDDEEEEFEESEEGGDSDEAMSVTRSESPVHLGRSAQPRTVSISGEDIAV
mmetsp:Transcript_18720/g.40296  ORF Transcript_18720/g.40296 Transcript_18720/m.40296 type:complete len:511 (+) Transcript_18720:131-1663(+)